jgi:hypothetical protein
MGTFDTNCSRTNSVYFMERYLKPYKGCNQFNEAAIMLLLTTDVLLEARRKFLPLLVSKQYRKAWTSNFRLHRQA